MKAYVTTTGLLFALMTVLHIWRAVAEWPPALNLPFVLEVVALVGIPGALAGWAVRVLRR